MVGAIIVPSSDEHLEVKMGTTDEGETPAIVLTRRQRADLWQDDALALWAWAYGYNEYHFSQLRRAMTDLAAEDGLKIEFVCIAGGEGAFGAAKHDVATEYQPDNLICSNPIRTVDVSKKNGSLRKVDGYGKLKPSPEGDKQLIERIKNGTLRASYVLKLLYAPVAHDLQQTLLPQDKIEQASMERLEACLKAAGTSQVCSTSKGPEKSKLQYVPAENVPMTDGLPSSTRVCGDIRKFSGVERFDSIRNIALNPKKLLEFVDAESSRTTERQATFELGGSSTGEE